ncbi:hypothetical protein QTN47_15405 [Danxiaibacter flavus]|uniref:NfeD-like C-terminal domain-containing protein n=1 Tax=Danxiaibacter flavus TaxID=3049108 RepID=A0ABV3ZKD3_9BACT|nr:hypothetical protein QNM32_15415 [Chitinophagaceae bacterium DXS]
MNILLSSFDAWWLSKTSLEQILWGTAVIATVLLGIQTLTGFLGGDHHSAFGDADDATAHDDGIHSQFFTVKNLLAFFTMFGWVGLGVFSISNNITYTLLSATGAGVATMILIAWLFKQISRLQYNGTTELKNAVGQVAKVYLNIPGGRTGTGKVHVTIQSALKELDAITDDGDALPTGSNAKVIAVITDDTLLVTKNN